MFARRRDEGSMDRHLNKVIGSVQRNCLAEVRLVCTIWIPTQVVWQRIDPTIQSRVQFRHDALLPLLLADL